MPHYLIDVMDPLIVVVIVVINNVIILYDTILYS
jgi:hypothetical protein